MNELLSSLFEKLKQFTEIIFVLFLDYILTVAMWYLKSKTDTLAGFEQLQQKDPAFKWILLFSTYGLYIVLSCYIISDIARQALKTYLQIRQQLKETSNNTH